MFFPNDNNWTKAGGALMVALVAMLYWMAGMAAWAIYVTGTPLQGCLAEYQWMPYLMLTLEVAAVGCFLMGRWRPREGR